MGITLTRTNVVDLIDVTKPRNVIASSSISGQRDKARGKLAQKLKQTKIN